jgi:hypothetical protein
MTDRLGREGDPPSGLLASPYPQYWNDDANDYERVKGSNGALYWQAKGYKASDFESVTVDDSATELTSGTYGDAVRAVITCEDSQVRFRVDGSDPTDSVGHILDIDSMLILDSADDIAAFRAIRTGSSDATLMVTYQEVA